MITLISTREHTGVSPAPQFSAPNRRVNKRLMRVVILMTRSVKSLAGIGELSISIWNLLALFLTQLKRVTFVRLSSKWGRLLAKVLATCPSSARSLWLMTIVQRFLPLLKRLQIMGPDILVVVVTLLTAIVLHLCVVNSDPLMSSNRLCCRRVATWMWAIVLPRWAG